MSKKILIVCGHGQGDPGAVGNGYKEYERVRFMGKKILAYLNKYSGIEAKLYNTDKDLFQQGNISSVSKGYDHVIELHLNSATASATGTEVLTFLEGIDAVDEACLKAGAKFWYNRGYKNGAWLYNAVNCSCAYRLVEFCFISNSGDMKIFNNKANEIAEEYAKKVATSLGGKLMNETKTHYYTKILDNFSDDKHKFVQYRLQITNSWGDGSVNFYEKFENGELKNKLGRFSKGNILQSLGNAGFTKYGANGAKSTDRYLIHKVYSRSLNKWGYITYKKEYK